MLVTFLPSGRCDCRTAFPGIAAGVWEAVSLWHCFLSISVKRNFRKCRKETKGTCLHFLENFNQCSQLTWLSLKRWSLGFSHKGCQGMESWNHLGQKRPLKSSDHVFYRPTDEWVLQKPQYTPGLPSISPRCLNQIHVQTLQIPGMLDVCENPNCYLWDHKGNVFGEKRVSPQAFWLWCLELQTERYDTFAQTLDLFFPANSLITLVNSCEVCLQNTKSKEQQTS